MTNRDPYEVVIPLPPEPPVPPEVQAEQLRQELFAQEHATARTVPLHPVRRGRQRVPAGSTGLDAAGAEPGAMCILGPDGAHIARGKNCPHRLPAPGDPDEIMHIDFRA